MPYMFNVSIIKWLIYPIKNPIANVALNKSNKAENKTANSKLWNIPLCPVINWTKKDIPRLLLPIKLLKLSISTIIDPIKTPEKNITIFSTFMKFMLNKLSKNPKAKCV